MITLVFIYIISCGFVLSLTCMILMWIGLMKTHKVKFKESSFSRVIENKDIARKVLIFFTFMPVVNTISSLFMLYMLVFKRKKDGIPEYENAIDWTRDDDDLDFKADEIEIGNELYYKYCKLEGVDNPMPQTVRQIVKFVSGLDKQQRKDIEERYFRMYEV